MLCNTTNTLPLHTEVPRGFSGKAHKSNEYIGGLGKNKGEGSLGKRKEARGTSRGTNNVF